MLNIQSFFFVVLLSLSLARVCPDSHAQRERGRGSAAQEAEQSEFLVCKSEAVDLFERERGEKNNCWERK